MFGMQPNLMRPASLELPLQLAGHTIRKNLQHLVAASARQTVAISVLQVNSTGLLPSSACGVGAHHTCGCFRRQQMHTLVQALGSVITELLREIV